MDAIEEVKTRINIEDVVSEYVTLKRAGRNFKGLSPFNPEKTPSFIVSPEKQIWHDFSSGKGGNVFSFVMEMEGLEFRGALELLARKAGVDLDQYKTSVRTDTKTKDRLYEANELATKFYQSQLKANLPALEYLIKKRLFSKDTIIKFRLGYSPNGNNALTSFLIKKGFNEAEIKKAGLATTRYQGLGDMFRGRIMIPLMDAQGRIIGFTARQLQDEPNSPKYINTPQTIIYDKSRHVFGLNFAKEEIRKTKFAVVVEGNLDVISSHQVNVNNVIATAGTAITEGHLKILKRFTSDIRLAYDKDNAGLNAAERTIPLAAKTDVELSIIDVLDAKDPDELIKKDPNIWKTIIEKKVYAMDWLIERHKNAIDLTTAQGKRQFSEVIVDAISKIEDSVVVDHYLTKVAELTGVSRDAIKSKYATKTGSPTRNVLKKAKIIEIKLPDKSNTELLKLQDHLLCLMLMQSQVRALHMPLIPELLSTDYQRQLHDFINYNPDFSLNDAWPNELTNMSDYVKILILQFEELYQGVEMPELMAEATRLKTQLLERYVKTIKLQLSYKLQNTINEDEIALLLVEAKRLDKLLSEKGARAHA